MDMYVKSPLNYVGGKYKILSQIIKLFPTDMNIFVDLFGGGFNVGANVACKNIIYTDKQKDIAALIKWFYETPLDTQKELVKEIMDKYKLDIYNEEGYKKLREDYNKEKTCIGLFMLIAHSFNNQFRFNNKGMFNMPFGYTRSTYNSKISANHREFVQRIQGKTCMILDKPFDCINIDGLSAETFVYCDPPYLGSTASYNERDGWTGYDEGKLRKLLEILHSRNIKFALSNNLTVNPTLKEWGETNGFTVHSIYSDYSNCNHQKDRLEETKEILITNY